MVVRVMIGRRWRTAFATVVGTSHLRNGSPCQDASGCIVLELPDGSEVLVAATSDGAGTAARSMEGAELAVSSFLTDFGIAATRDSLLSSIDRLFVEDWLHFFQLKVSRLAEDAESHPRDYSCTLLGAIVGPTSAVYVQIGDGAIVVGSEGDGEYAWIAWPQHGEYANQTYFLTQSDASSILIFERGPSVDEIALFTDGIERLVLNLSDQSVHSPAFKPIFKWLAQTEPERSGKTSEALSAYLASDYINARTDDDKSLVIATRIDPVASEARQ
jgi:hypothetical protein